MQGPSPTETTNSGALSDTVVAAAAAAEEGELRSCPCHDIIPSLKCTKWQDQCISEPYVSRAGKDHARKGKSVAAKYSEFFNHEHGGSGKKDIALDKERQLQQTASAVPAFSFAPKQMPKRTRRVNIQTMWRAMHATVSLLWQSDSLRS